MPNPIEESIVKKFEKTIWLRFLKSVKEYHLIQAGDKIAVCLSGGRDSVLMAKCMQRMQRYGIYSFEAVFIVINHGFSEAEKNQILANAALLEIPLRISDDMHTDCFETQLYQAARSAGCHKIALGHHFDDVIETILMGMLCDSQIRTIMPKARSEAFPEMQMIRPIYLVRENDIIAWQTEHHLEFVQTEYDEKRQNIRKLLTQLRNISPAVDKNIFRSVENVNLKTLISYHIGEETHHFLDDFDQNITNHGTKSGEGRKEKNIC